MWEDKFEVYKDALGDRKIVERVASDMSLEDALLFIKACIQEYWRELNTTYTIKHMPMKEEDNE